VAGEIGSDYRDKDGTNSGFDLELINAVRSTVTIPVIVSSSADVPGIISRSSLRP
jgi:glutamine amidotransferase/cyclase